MVAKQPKNPTKKCPLHAHQCLSSARLTRAKNEKKGDVLERLTQPCLLTNPDSLTQPVAKIWGVDSHRLAAGTLESHHNSVSMIKELTY